MTDDAVIIETCLNGNTTKAVNEHVPRTPEEITADILASLDAGAAIVHTHTDDPNFGGTGRHDAAPYLKAWKPVLEQRPDALLYPTMEGGGPHTTIETRMEHVRELNDAGVLKIAIVDMGTANMGGMDERGVPTASDAMFLNTNADFHYMLYYCRRTGLGSSIGIIEYGYMRALLGFWRNGLVPPGAIVRLIFGSDRALGGLPPTKAALDLYLDVLDGTGLPWSVGVMGGNPLDSGFARYALERGGHIRIGLEDFAAPGPTNAELVTAAAALVREVGRPLATPSSAAKQLGLPGGRWPTGTTAGDTRAHPRA